MNLRAIRPSFLDLSLIEQLQHIQTIRDRRSLSQESVRARRALAAKSPKTPRAQKKAVAVLDNISPEMAAKLLAMLGDQTDEPS